MRRGVHVFPHDSGASVNGERTWTELVGRRHFDHSRPLGVAGCSQEQQTDQQKSSHPISRSGALKYLSRMASPAMYVRASKVPVGFAPGFCGYSAAPATNTFGVSQTWPYLLQTELLGSAPMMAPPVQCVLWYS